MECTGLANYLYKNYLYKNALLSEKRAQQHCESLRKMFRIIKKGKGRHLISIVQPHFQTCGSCQEWAHKKRYDIAEVFREAS